MRRSCSAHLVDVVVIVVALGLAGALAGCGGGVTTISLQLRKGDPAVASDGLQSLHVFVSTQDGADDGDQVIALDRGSQATLEATVGQGAVFVVDVWGCDSGTCLDEAAISLRGCDGPVDTEGKRGAIIVPIDMFDAAAPEVSACPPAFPSVR